MEKSCQLIIELEEIKKENERLCCEIEKKGQHIQNLQTKDNAQQQEIESLNRSLDACVFYQGDRRQDGKADVVSGNKLREIYYELGKRQTDIHAMSLSLSEVNTQLKELQQQYDELQRDNSTIQLEMKHVKEYNDQLLQNNITMGKEISRLEGESVGLRECNGKLQDDVTSLMDKLKSSMLGSSEMEEINQNKISTLNATIEDLNDSNRHLSERLEALTLSLKHRESVLALTEKRLEVETQRIQEDRASLAESLRQGEVHSSQIEMLRSNMSNALYANELLARESREMSDTHRVALETLTERCTRTEAHNRSLQEQLRDNSSRVREMEKEREEMVGAFKKSIAAAKALSTRLSLEQATSAKLRQELHQTEQSMQQIIKAKEQVSNAVLDALYKERSQHNNKKSNMTQDDSPDCTPTSRPPLSHPLASCSTTIHRDDETSRQFLNSAFMSETPVAKQQHDDSPTFTTSDNCSSTHNIIDVSEDKDATTAEEHSDLLQDDSLHDSLTKYDDSVFFNRIELRGDLQRLRKEVDMLELKSQRETKERENAFECNDDPLRNDRDFASRIVPCGGHQQSTENSTSVLEVKDDKAVPHSISPRSSNIKKSEHTLFDLIDLDPRVAFEQSPPRTRDS